MTHRTKDKCHPPNIFVRCLEEASSHFDHWLRMIGSSLLIAHRPREPLLTTHGSMAIPKRYSKLDAALAMNDVMNVSQAWDVVTRWAVEELLQYLRQTVPEAENQWNVIMGSRKDCVPDDVYNTDFWNASDPSQWEAAMTVCTGAKAKRKEVVERWLEAASLCRGFNRRFDGCLQWPDDVIEEVLEDVLSILEPLSNLDRVEEEQRFRADATDIIWLQEMD